LVDVAYTGAVEALLEHSPDFIVDWIEIWELGYQSTTSMVR